VCVCVCVCGVCVCDPKSANELPAYEQRYSVTVFVNNEVSAGSRLD